ncbi:DUF2157 domain-containing protein [Spongiimicrobium sp. 2-473A-2-J]|uniref:DUF2157 domain-containing protein n=1 Tax=Eudoraea algarum TaxID=3417568 RepID=UPI003D360FBF
MSILKDLPNLVNAEVISKETADKIRAYYQNKEGPPSNKLFVVFGILGAILVGLGIILIIAHNWDELSRGTKTIFAFLPLIVGQLFCGYTLLKRKQSVAWRESSAAFLFFAVGASISLVSQIYHIPGNLGSFLLVWMLLCLPLIYVMQSSMASLLYLVGITYYAGEVSYWSYPSSESYFYWLLLLGVFPHYYQLIKKRAYSNFVFFHNWLIPISLTIVLGTVAEHMDELMFIAYFSLFGLFYLIGGMDFLTQQRLRNNSYKLLGALGTSILLLSLSFDWFWESLRRKEFLFNEVIIAPEFWVSAFLSVVAGVLFFLQYKNKGIRKVKPFAPVFLLFILTFLLGLYSPLAGVLINFYIFILGILTIREGALQNHLGILNYGLLVITALVICRFFDTDLSFVIRGILFVSVGIGFFATNYWMLKKRRTDEQ